MIFHEGHKIRPQNDYNRAQRERVKCPLVLARQKQLKVIIIYLKVQVRRIYLRPGYI